MKTGEAWESAALWPTYEKYEISECRFGLVGWYEMTLWELLYFKLL